MPQIYGEAVEQQEKAHNTTQTQRESYTKLNNDGQRIREKALVYDTLKRFGPLTSRELSRLTKKERTNITRSLYDLRNEIVPQVRIAFIRPCPVTGRKVEWYCHTDWKDPETQSPAPINNIPDNLLTDSVQLSFAGL